MFHLVGSASSRQCRSKSSMKLYFTIEHCVESILTSQCHILGVVSIAEREETSIDFEPWVKYISDVKLALIGQKLSIIFLFVIG